MMKARGVNQGIDAVNGFMHVHLVSYMLSANNTDLCLGYKETMSKFNFLDLSLW
jgi:hypothetical protein